MNARNFKLGELTGTGKLMLAIVLVLLALLPFFSTEYIQRVAIICFYLAFVGQAWNLMLGFAGLLSIGHALFVGIGAYTSAYMFKSFGIPALIGIVPGILLAIAVGAFIGYLGFRFAVGGVYFALLTIGFAEVTNILVAHADFLGGTQGLFLPPINAEDAKTIDILKLRGRSELHYYFMFLLCFAGLIFCRALLNARIGYFWRAIRDNPEAAEAAGVPVFRYRMYAVMASAGMAALAGIIYPPLYPALFPQDLFGIEKSIEVTLAPIVGGVGTLFGPIMGAFMLTPLSEGLTVAVDWLKEVGVLDPQAKVGGIKFIVWGFAVVAIVLFQPRGIWPWVCRKLGLVKPPGS